MRDPQSRPGLDLKPVTPELSQMSDVDISIESEAAPNKEIMKSA